MQVTQSNLNLIADEIISLIETCDFYSMDQEMTGIETDEGPPCPLSSLAAGYSNRANAARQYQAFQCGLCLFHRVRADSGVPRYEARPFNFWIRPRPHNGRADVTLNMSAVDFLLRNGMDFQFWLSQGVPFVSAAGEARERAYHFPLDSADPLPEAAQDWIKATADLIDGWFREGSGESFTLKTSHVSVEADFGLWAELCRRETFVISEPSLLGRLPPFARTETIFKRADAQQVREVSEESHRRSTQTFNSSLGFRRIFNALTAQKHVPMVGHNFSSDLMFFLQMFDQDIPTAYPDFKARTHSLFPRVFDTKTLANVLPNTPFANTSLEPLFKELDAIKRKPFEVKLPMGFESYAPSERRVGQKSDAVAHQGAFDAYMTGLVYLHFVHGSFDAGRLASHENHISVFGAPFFMRLDGDDLYANCCAYRLSAAGKNRREIEAVLMSESERAEREKSPRSRCSFSVYAAKNPGDFLLVIPVGSDVLSRVNPEWSVEDLISWQSSQGQK